jgi:hypothetical protein
MNLVTFSIFHVYRKTNILHKITFSQSEANQIYSANLNLKVDSYSVIQNIPFFYVNRRYKAVLQNPSLGTILSQWSQVSQPYK